MTDLFGIVQIGLTLTVAKKHTNPPLLSPSPGKSVSFRQYFLSALFIFNF